MVENPYDGEGYKILSLRQRNEFVIVPDPLKSVRSIKFRQENQRVAVKLIKEKQKELDFKYKQALRREECGLHKKVVQKTVTSVIRKNEPKITIDKSDEFADLPSMMPTREERPAIDILLQRITGLLETRLESNESDMESQFSPSKF